MTAQLQAPGYYAHSTSPVMTTSYAQHQQQQAYKPGTLPPGVTIGIGEYVVTIERFLSEGGFAHVYLVYSQDPIPRNSNVYQHVLKRVAVPDKETLKEVRWEVDVMKLVRGHKHIVNLIEASASPIPGTTGYEVFILMEYCPGGGIIDMMNTRLQNRLTEQEILKIFSDVVEGVCWMHTRDPPLMHRDLKVENILLAGRDYYKLCDFGSSTTPRARPPQNSQEIQALEAELNKHTTLQYRAPEMCDVWSRRGVGLPADIWALGVLLYKLCFYTTPFEEQGPLAILNVQYVMPEYPNYSKNIRSLIASMLVEAASARPNAYMVHEQVCQLRGTKPNTNYRLQAAQTRSSAPSPAFNHNIVPSNLPSRPASGLDNVLAQRPVSSAPQAQASAHLSGANGVSPMRRGRPAKSATTSTSTALLTSASTSNLRSEWQAPQNASPSSPGAAGFGDSFAPLPQSEVSEALGVGILPVADEPDPLPQSKTAAATAALFEELTSPGSTVKAAPTLASLAAARQAGNGSAPPAAHVPNGLRKITPTKPLGPRPPPGSSSTSEVSGRTTITMPLSIPQTMQAPVPSVSPKPASALGQLETSDNAGPASSSIKIDTKSPTDKPKLVSRGSQTSPTLLSEWKKREAETLMQKSTQARLSALRENSGGSPQMDSAPPKSKVEAFPSIDEWEQASFSPPLPGRIRLPSGELDQGQQSQATVAPFDLLADDADGMGTALSQRTERSFAENAEAVRMSMGSNVDASDGQNSDVEARRIANSLSSSEPQSASQKPEPPRGKFRPVKTESPIAQRRTSATSFASLPVPLVKSPQPMSEAGADSSDDEPARPEDPIGGQYSSHMTQSTDDVDVEPSKAEREPSGNFNIEPALASIEKFAPKKAPPILAPKPKPAGISNIVSRYEDISVTPKGSYASEAAEVQAKSKPDKPAKPPKPSASMVSSPSLEDFQSRFPAVDSVDGEKPGFSPSVIRRQPFKPSRDNSSQSISSLAGVAPKESNARPQSMHFPTSPGVNTPELTKGREDVSHAKEGGDDDEGFKGVASLRDRWQKNISSQQQSQPNNGSDRRNTVRDAASRWTGR